MAAAEILLVFGGILPGILCEAFEVILPGTIEVLKGSCVTIPCSFDIESEYSHKLHEGCKAMWRFHQDKVDNTVFDSQNPESNKIKGNLSGTLMNKECTTTLENMQPGDSHEYFFRLQCDNKLNYNFLKTVVKISVTDETPTPTLSLSTMTPAKEGTPVILKCFAPAPCQPHPPSLTWSPRLGDSQEKLEDSDDRTKVQTSVLTFNASHLHDRQIISCTAVYSSNRTSVSNRLTTHVSYSPKPVTVSINPPCPVTEDGNVTLTCKSTANPAARNFSWFRADGGQRTFIGKGQVLNVKASEVIGPFFCEAENSVGVGRSGNHYIDVKHAEMLAVWIGSCVVLLVLVCVLLLIIRTQMVRLRIATRTIALSQRASGKENMVPQTTAEEIYVNVSVAMQTHHQPAASCEPNSNSLATTGKTKQRKPVKV